MESGTIFERVVPDAELEELENRFTYHAPNEEQARRYPILRGEAHALARSISRLTRPCREQSLALTKLEEAVFWANAAIARRE
jgi:hypothetical protein